MPDAKPRTKVLFVCTGNACRSQMAEGWTRARWGDRIEVHSAGVMPCGVSSLSARVMKEAGVDISKHTSKHVRDVAHIPFDFVITVCGYADQRCPTFPGGGKRIHRPFDDPPTLSSTARSEEEELAIYRRIRDEIRAYVETLPKVLGLPREAG